MTWLPSPARRFGGLGKVMLGEDIGEPRTSFVEMGAAARRSHDRQLIPGAFLARQLSDIFEGVLEQVTAAVRN